MGESPAQNVATRSPLQRRRIPMTVVTKPTGAACNLDCSYCFFLSKELLYNAKQQLMSEEVLEGYIAEFLAGSPDGEVTLLWQGGEPTMRGLPFFDKAVELAKAYARPTQYVTHAIQTNATLINEEWADFLAKNDFLVGVSIDGPAPLHDAYRVNRAGRATYELVRRGWDLLQAAGARMNLLCTVHAANQDHPLEIYHHFRDNLGAQFIQFIPIVERVAAHNLPAAERGWHTEGLLYRQEGDSITSRTVDPKKYGEFLSEIFDEWVTRDIGSIFVQDFDGALGNLFGQPAVCVHSPQCGNTLAMEFNGDVYTCDHWVEPEWRIGNVTELPFSEMVSGEVMGQFARKKQVELTTQCKHCPFLRQCWGGCPKDRFRKSVDGEPGQNFLCEGYYRFFEHIEPDIVAMARLIQLGRSPAEIQDPAVREEFRGRVLSR